ncbi:PDR/VanB family oxidoreductase [Pseudonocardia acidicola]|uniref:Oxidoreductase n=1 Tax=Pseudonocardia acidicola TaxID=2724939 RepID=A0ABX1S9N3_9PSEU|nr:PDR/VanB family oxidoreductase [Pseudonocardia acidicola]NMH98261.1 oxidoreductase [Pseudonocardia acidicola]
MSPDAAVLTERLTLTVEATRTVSEDVLLVELRRTDGGDLPPWDPGAHVEVELPSGLRRQYSLCGDPDRRDRYEIAVLREPEGRGGSIELHEVASPGAELWIGLPRNNFPLRPAVHYLFVAGGIGVTPILPMVAAAERAGATWRLVYGARTSRRLSFLDRLEQYGTERVDLWPEDERGRPNLVAELDRTDPSTLVYACGPGGMLDAVALAYAQRPDGRALHVERFGVDQPVDVTGDEIEVVLARSGHTLTVPGEQSILSAVREVLPRTPYSCEEGYCGECETPVLEGTPDHRDTYLSDDEREGGETMMLCVSRCAGRRLVLDL